LLQPLHRLPHESRSPFQVPLCVGDMHMAEVRGQQGQAARGLLPGPIPVEESMRRETVAHIVQTRATTVAGTPQPELP
jgi:hypothetical protein